MRTSSKAMAAGIIVLAMAASGAQAQEVMSTAGATGAPISDAVATEPAATPPVVAPLEDTSAQIQRWLAESPTNPDDRDGRLLDLRREDRQMHGEVGVAIGTGGYRSAYITSVMPLGDKGTLALSFSQDKNARGYYRGAYGYPYGVPLGEGLMGYGAPGRGPVW